MAHAISDECVNCGVCQFSCPRGAIVESEHVYVILRERCDDCGACVPHCPARAIVPDVPATARDASAPRRTALRD